jgi:hypothetical protein
MEYGKYIIIRYKDGRELAIMFDNLFAHDSIWENPDMIISAGFFVVGGTVSNKEDMQDIEVIVWGESISLKKKSRKEDRVILKKVLRKEDNY